MTSGGGFLHETGTDYGDQWQYLQGPRWQDVTSLSGGSPETGIHFTYTFGANDVTSTLTSIATGNPIISVTRGITLADIAGVRVGGNCPRQSITLANFSVASVPEPSAALLYGLGMLGSLRRRRNA